MQVDIYNMKGEKTGMVNLPDAVFGLPWNAALVKQVTDAEYANMRENIAHTKNRGDVSGGGKKPWKQKGTGRARHGSIRSPIWIGGGVAHGPRTERVYDKNINKRMRRKALLVSLSEKARGGEVVVMEELAFPEARTCHAAAVLRALASAGISRIGAKGGTALVTLPAMDGFSVRAFRNLPHIASSEARNITARQVLSVKYLIIPKAAIPVFESVPKFEK